MIANQRVTYRGYEVSLFPLDYLNCTQIPQTPSYTHCCGTATDWIGTSGTYPIYAPFSCHEITAVADNTKAYLSNDKVWTPNGLMPLVVAFTHDSNPPSATSFTQGELIAHTGTAGYVTGDHVHLDQSVFEYYQLISSGQTCTSGRLCYELLGGVLPPQAYYLSGDEAIVTTLGLDFQIWQGVAVDTVMVAIMKKKLLKKKGIKYLRR